MQTEGANNSHGEPIPGRLHWRNQSTGAVAGREGPELGGRNTDAGRGGAQATTGRLNRPAEVPLTGVVLHTSNHTGIRGGLQDSRKGTLGVISPGSLPQGDGAHAQLDNHRIDGKSCRGGNTIHEPDRKG